MHARAAVTRNERLPTVCVVRVRGIISHWRETQRRRCRAAASSVHGETPCCDVIREQARSVGSVGNLQRC